MRAHARIACKTYMKLTSILEWSGIVRLTCEPYMKLIVEWGGRIWLTLVALRGSYVLVNYSGMVDKYPGRVAFVKLTTSSAYVTP